MRGKYNLNGLLGKKKIHLFNYYTLQSNYYNQFTKCMYLNYHSNSISKLNYYSKLFNSFTLFASSLIKINNSIVKLNSAEPP